MALQPELEGGTDAEFNYVRTKHHMHSFRVQPSKEPGGYMAAMVGANLVRPWATAIVLFAEEMNDGYLYVSWVDEGLRSPEPPPPVDLYGLALPVVDG